MDTRTFHMLHYAGDQDLGAVRDRVNLGFPPFHVLVHENGIFLTDPVDDFHELGDVFVRAGYFHALAAEYVGRPHEHRVAENIRGGDGFFFGEDGFSGGPGNGGFLEHFVEELAVFRAVNIGGRGAEEGHSHGRKRLRELDGRLAAELHDRGVGFLVFHDVFNVFRGERFEVEPVGDVEVGTHGFRLFMMMARYPS